MKTKYLAVAGFAMFVGGMASAGWRPVVYQYENLTQEQKLERAIRQDQAMIEGARTESKLISQEALRRDGERRLAADQAELDTFKTAGPTSYERTKLENEIASARFESKLLSRQARIAAAEKKLAELK